MNQLYGRDSTVYAIDMTQLYDRCGSTESNMQDPATQHVEQLLSRYGLLPKEKRIFAKV